MKNDTRVLSGTLAMAMESSADGASKVLQEICGGLAEWLGYNITGLIVSAPFTEGIRFFV